jgi:hypothetical protein
MLNFVPNETNRGVDKVRRYGWTVSDKPGVFKMIAKTALRLDHEAYQREQREAKSVRMAGEWSWVACGALTVAARKSGVTVEFYVIDGGHRLLAALKRSDIAALPCMVFEVGDVRGEAHGFLQANTERKPITSRDRFRALVTTGDECAAFVRDLLDNANRSEVGEGNSARCFTALLKLAAAKREELTRLWPIIDHLCRGQAIHNHLLRAMVYVESHMPEGESLTDARWRNRLISVGVDALVESMNKAAAFRAKSGERVWGEGIVQRLNHGLQNKLVLRP